MSRFKAGQSIVLDILDISDDGYYKLGNENRSWWSTCTSMDEMAEPLTDYTMPLINKIERQRNGITSLLNQNADLKRENAELKNKVRNMEDTFNTFKTSMCDACEHIDSVEKARAVGEEAGWELARNILNMDYIDFKEIFGERCFLSDIMETPYSEAAAKVAAWERQKEEICVGDVVIYNNTPNIHGVVIEIKENCLSVVWQNGSYTYAGKSNFTKTGRHIDVEAWLAQIGGDVNEK